MKKSSIFGLVVIAIAIAVIISVYSNTSSYGNFADAEKTTSELKVVGRLNKQKELHYDATKDANYFSFYMRDTLGTERKVVFTGTKPEDFEKSEQIVLTGKMVRGEFHASSILMKCPSKYTQDKIDTKEFKAKQQASI
ncbi:cytochrome c maturation protein CcmE domain-containing protein [Mucilaginibacter pedocola]|uniref:Cytochrome C biogenesis protein n=1 Tax=Mucilaginibacter pedocola TaxID=1792845 RepID=A0A1S9PHA2_9SPHI|nr:cytochrome c maturation protein CcmE [Mucilaginibacter pedocola]OOQ60315.1 cytochrome C biogenesis protein [Mucilaginibacter pedocola]